MQNNKISRRNALKTMGTAFALLGLSQITNAHEGNSTVEDTNRENLIVESGPGQLVTFDFAHHHHLLKVPLELLRNPPDQGVELETEWAEFRNPLANFGKHFHTVIITKEQLTLVGQNQLVIVEDTVKDHKYSLQLRPESLYEF